jgi:hypothetical protein
MDGGGMAGTGQAQQAARLGKGLARAAGDVEAQHRAQFFA